MINIVLVVLSSILLILVIGLIFKKDFREDVLKTENDNEAEFKGIKLKGALFWVIYAATAFGTIYLAMNIPEPQSIVQNENCTPLLASANSHDWLALDINEEKPAILEFGCCDKKNQEDHSKRNLNLNLALNDAFEIISTKSKFIFGELDKESLKKLNLSNDLKVEKYVEISYDLQLSPFRSKRNNSEFYDWNEYENLPFKVEVRYTEERQMHVLIVADDGNKSLMDPLSIGLDKWTEMIDIEDKKFLIRLRSQDTNPNNSVSEHANFQVLQFSRGGF